MSLDPSGLQRAFLETARILARGGDVDAKLTALGEEGRALIGARASLVYLLDGAARSLVPAGVAELSEVQHEELTLSADDPDDPAAATVRDRRGQDAIVEERSRYRILDPGIRAISCLPLVVEDATGSQEVQGVLVAGFDRPLEDEPTREALGALADLAAVVIRQTRLERAVIERSDWYDRVAHTDPLTGLANRRTFDRMLELELARAARQGTPLSLAIFDIDGLAEISRSHGAEVGDDILRQVAASLADSVRLVDTIARFGGDEFGLVAPGSAGGTVARRVLDSVALLDPVDGTGAIRVSAGVARFPEDGTTAQTLLTAADEALREAKRRGGATVISSSDI